MTPVSVTEGAGPLILGLPHAGTWVPPAIGAKLNAEGRKLADADWHIDTFYHGLAPDLTVVRANFHRYVIDANRDPSGATLYPGQNTTGLVPETDFDGRPIWDAPVTRAEIEDRRQRFHAPYHAALTAQIERVRARHGVAILYDCHSIRSRIPHLFDGVLPDFNIGTNGGTTCATSIENAVLGRVEGHSHVLNGRFKGGWTTRHYGRPEQGWHAIQMELAQSIYLQAEAPPWHPDPGKVARMRDVLAGILNDIIVLAPSLKVIP